MTKQESKDLNVSICEGSVWAFCTEPGCDARQQIAPVKMAEDLTRESVLFALVQLGWAVAPRFLCVNHNNRKKWFELLDRWKDENS